MVKEKEGDPDERRELFRPKLIEIRASEHEGYDLDFRSLEDTSRDIYKRLLEAYDRPSHVAPRKVKEKDRLIEHQFKMIEKKHIGAEETRPVLQRSPSTPPNQGGWKDTRHTQAVIRFMESRSILTIST